MRLATDLIRDFVKETNDLPEGIKETTCYGTARFRGDESYVQIDGSDYLTPASYATSAHENDRVLVLLKSRSAVVIANITTPTITTGVLKANVGIIVNGYLTTNELRTEYDDISHTGLTFSSGGIGAYGGNNKYWYVTDMGDLYASSAEIVGNITASSGFLGTKEKGFKIDATGIYSGTERTAGNASYISLSTEKFARTINGTGRTKLVFAIGSKFGVDDDGVVHAAGADISGAITAESGFIGTAAAGFHINSSGIYSGSYGSDTTSGSISLSNAEFQRSIDGTSRSGLKFAIGSKFGVTSAGKIYASDVELKGAITATSGEVGDFTVNKALYSGSKSTFASTASGVYLGTDGIALGTNSPFKVTSAGYLTAASGTIGGWTIGTDILYKTVTIDDSTYRPTLYAPSSPSLNTGVFYVRKVTGSTTTYPFLVKYNGELTATSGYLGGWVLTSTSLSSKNTTARGDIPANVGTGIQIPSNGTWAIAVAYDTTQSGWGTAPFRVSHAGKMYATGADIEGKITATSGSLKNLTISTGLLISGYMTTNASRTSYNQAVAGMTMDANGIGGWGSASALWTLTKGGVFTAKSANITGTIDATSARIKDTITMYTTYAWGVSTNVTIQYVQSGGTSLAVDDYTYNGGVAISSDRKNIGWTDDYPPVDPAGVYSFALKISNSIDVYGGAYFSGGITSKGSIQTNEDIRVRKTVYCNAVYANGLYSAGAIGTGAKAAWNDTANPGTWLTTTGAIHMSQSATCGGAIGFHYNFSANSTSYITEEASGTLVVGANKLNVRNSSSTDNVWVEAKNKNFEIRLAAHEKAGVYSDTPNAKWLINIDSSGTVVANTSDIRYKIITGDMPEEEALAVLRGCKLINFYYKEDKKRIIQNGVSAQELRDILIKKHIGFRPYFSIESAHDDSTYTDLTMPDSDIRYGIDYGRMVPVLWKGWQSHDDRIAALEIENANLKEEIKKLKGAA